MTNNSNRRPPHSHYPRDPSLTLSMHRHLLYSNSNPSGAQGKYLEALECMERGLVLRQHFFGADSDEVWRACKTVGEMCNLLAMTYLQQEDFAMVLELLKKGTCLKRRLALHYPHDPCRPL